MLDIKNTDTMFLSQIKTVLTGFPCDQQLMAYLVTDCDICDTEEEGTWGHLSPSNPRH